MMISLKTNSVHQTQKVAKLLAQEILKDKPKRKEALVLALTGELGAGKTTFIQGFVRGLGIKKRIISPTFVLIKNYKLRALNYKLLSHIDCYRISKPSELLQLGIAEIFKNSQALICIEWAEKIQKILPKNTLWLKFKHSRKYNERTIYFSTYQLKS